MSVPMQLITHFLGLVLALSALDLRVGDTYREVAAIAYHFHWSRDECMAMSGRERRMWLGEIGRINKEIAKSMKAGKKRRT